MDVTPTTAIWALLSAPFLARWALAGTRWYRVHGFSYAANVEPRIEMSDFPPPNRAGRELARYLVATFVAIPIAFITDATVGRAVPPWVWQAVLITAIGPAVAWIFLGLRSDDRLWLRLKRERIAARAHVTFADVD